MTREHTVPPTRLVDLPPDHDLAKLGVLVDSVPQVPSVKLPLVKWRIRSTLRRRVEWRRRALRVVIVGSLLFLAGSVVGAMVQPILLSTLRAKIEKTDASNPRRRTPAAHGPAARRTPPTPTLATTETKDQVSSTDPLAESTVNTSEPVASAAVGLRRLGPEVDDGVAQVAAPFAKRTVAGKPAVARSPRAPSVSEMPRAAEATATPAGGPTPFLSPPPQPAPGVALAPTPEPAEPQVRAMTAPSAEPSRPLVGTFTPAPAAPASPQSEQALLAKALRSLPTDPQRALVLLDEHRNRFPRGSLAPEAARLRTRALLLSGRSEDALDELDRQVSVARPGPADEYRVLRGELQARAGHWRAALSDFELALQASSVNGSASTGAVDPSISARMERALWGRASARSHLGDQAGARADLREYLLRFPRGRFAPEAARLTGGGLRP